MTWHPDIPARVTDASGAAWLVRRAWPAPAAGDYILEVRAPPAPAGRNSSGVRAGHLRQGVFEMVPEHDPKLPSLAREASKGEVVVHRAHKRAVVHAGGQYAKVLRPGRAQAVAERHANATALAGEFFGTPRVLAAGSDVVVFSTLPGRSYYDLGQDQAALSDAGYAAIWSGWAQAWTAAVAASRGMACAGTLERLLPHPPGAEADNLRRWANNWLNHSEGVAEAAAARENLSARLDAAVGLLLSSRPDPPGWAHGDLHDKQILAAGGSAPALLDFDESCAAEPALDLANLDVHLELRRVQHLLTVRRYVIAHRQILAAADKLRVSPERFAAYAASTRLRLACLYSFRPPWGAEAARYLAMQSPTPAAGLSA